MPSSEKVGTLLRETPYVRVITPFFYWLSSKSAKSANIPTPRAGGTLVAGTLVGCARPAKGELI
jgi:hypothetical protein